MATAPHFLLRRDSVILQFAAVLARAKADFPAAVLRRAMEMDSRPVVAAVSFAVRFSPEPDSFVVALFALCRFPIRFATAGFVPAADPFDPADSDFAVVAAAVADPSGLSAADLSAADLSAADLSAADLSVVA